MTPRNESSRCESPTARDRASWTSRGATKRAPDQILAKLRDADVMLADNLPLAEPLGGSSGLFNQLTRLSQRLDQLSGPCRYL